MTIRERILSRADLAAALAARDLDALAGGLNAQPDMAAQPRWVTGRTILAECQDGGAILAALDAAAGANTAVKYAVQFLGQDSGLDVGNPATLGMIDALVPSVLTDAQASQIKALAMQPVLVDRLQIEAALFNPDGSEK